MCEDEEEHSYISALNNLVGDEKVNVIVLVNGVRANCLIDTGAKFNHIDSKFCQRAKLNYEGNSDILKLELAVKNSAIKTKGLCSTSVEFQGRDYNNVNFLVLENLLWDVILGCEFLSLHKSVKIDFGGPESSLKLGALSTLRGIKPVRLFEYLSPNIRPIATKRRSYSSTDLSFISSEISRLLADDIIEPSNSPWRAQVVVTKSENHKKRMCVDYSQTINKFTRLDAYPLPTMQSVLRKVSRYTWFSKLDLQSAYHQVSLIPEERIYTGFEAVGQLYQFKRIPFGLKNAVPCFQRVVNQIISDYKCEGIFAYLDDITVCGKTREEHDKNLKQFLKAASDCNLTLNENKCVFATRKLNLLGYYISDGVMRPDPERVKPIINLRNPTNKKELQRVIGMFSYYAQWLPQFSEKVRPLILEKQFPMGEKALNAFKSLKDKLVSAALQIIDENVPFVVETDASDNAISASLNQHDRPVAFFSRMLTKNERHHSSVEKEATAIVEAIRKWTEFLCGRHFTVITDQQSVAYMYNSKNHSKIKNNKILRWRMELSEYDFDIIYRSGKMNCVPDALSRAFCANIYDSTLHKLHESLCHPGVTRLHHFVRVKNLPYSVNEVRNVVAKCKVCSELRPNFYKPEVAYVIKATQPFERLSLDFKGPLPTSSKNRYLLTIVDEYSRFPFGFACPNVNAKTVISCLNQVFVMFGMPAYIHSDRGTAFISQELRSYLQKRGVACSRTSVYNAPGNGQCERYNGIIWSAIKSALKTRCLDVCHWQLVLPDALHSVRSLLCTATNETPHERMFSFKCRSTFGTSVPTWLSSPGPVYLKRHIRTSKYDPVVDKVDLLHATPNYAIVRLPNGRETTVSLKDVAPCTSANSDDIIDIDNENEESENVNVNLSDVSNGSNMQNESIERHDQKEIIGEEAPNINSNVTPVPRRSTRIRKAVDRYGAVPYN